MDTSKLIVVAIWATILVVAYEALRAFYASKASSPLGVPTSTGSPDLDSYLLAQAVDRQKGLAIAAWEADKAQLPSNPYAGMTQAAAGVLDNMGAINSGIAQGWGF